MFTPFEIFKRVILPPTELDEETDPERRRREVLEEAFEKDDEGILPAHEIMREELLDR